MKYNKKEIEILETIIEKEGKCFNMGLCGQCPFRVDCLSRYISIPNPIMSDGRKCQKALSVLGNMAFEELDD